MFLPQVRVCAKSSIEASMGLPAAVASETVAEELESVQAIFAELEIGSDLQSCAINCRWTWSGVCA